jgi:hypothetical protein
MFDYALTTSGPDRLVFTFPKPDTGGTAGKVIGWIILAVMAGGVAYALWTIAQGTLPWHRHPATLAIGIVLLFVSGAAFFWANAPEPHTFTVARPSGLVEMRAADGSAQAQWPLSQIRDVHTNETAGPDSHASGASTRWHHLTLRLRDGGQVHLLRTPNGGERDEVAAILRDMLQTAAAHGAAVAPAAPRLPPSLDVVRGPDDTVIRWRSSVQAASVAGLVAVAISVAVVATPLLARYRPPTRVSACPEVRPRMLPQ